MKRISDNKRLQLLIYECNTKCNYKIGQICEVIFYQDDQNNCGIAIVMELFFDEVMIKKNEQIGLICSYIWYKALLEFFLTLYLVLLPT